MKIIVLNAGSSSLKLSYFQVNAAKGTMTASSLAAAWSAEIEWSDGGGGEVTVQGNKQQIHVSGDHKKCAEELFARLWIGSGAIIGSADEIDVVGHRVVHGGGTYTSAQVISDEVMKDLRQFIELAPAHEPVNIEGVEIAKRVFPKAKQVAVFDTSFHHTLPESSYLYAVPKSWRQRFGIRRFGFHGISHQYCSDRAVALLNDTAEYQQRFNLKSAKQTEAELKIATCHLGSGCSVAAVLSGQSLMTSMGYTPLEGLIMRTRSGSIDPGIILQLIQDGKLTAEEALKELNKQSGLKAIFGDDGDMRKIEGAVKDAASSHSDGEKARLAFQMFVQSAAVNISAMATYMRGLDVLTFTGGIGENSSLVRNAVCDMLGFLGVKLDSAANAAHGDDRIISSSDSSIAVLTIKCREDKEIAWQCLKLAS